MPQTERSRDNNASFQGGVEGCAPQHLSLLPGGRCMWDPETKDITGLQQLELCTSNE